MTKREKNGMAYIKTVDEKGNFVENSNVKCEASNFMVTVQDENMYIVRTKDIAFYLCSTMSSDETKAKFDFTDRSFCQRCEKFDPENDLLIAGEDGDVDSDESITASETAKDTNSKDSPKDGASKDTDKDSVKSEQVEQKAVIMTHEMKLKVVKSTFNDWLE